MMLDYHSKICGIELSLFLIVLFGTGINGHFPTVYNHDGIAIICWGHLYKHQWLLIVDSLYISVDNQDFYNFVCFCMMEVLIKIILSSKDFKIECYLNKIPI